MRGSSHVPFHYPPYCKITPPWGTYPKWPRGFTSVAIFKSGYPALQTCTAQSNMVSCRATIATNFVLPGGLFPAKFVPGRKKRPGGQIIKNWFGLFPGEFVPGRKLLWRICPRAQLSIGGNVNTSMMCLVALRCMQLMTVSASFG